MSRVERYKPIRNDAAFSRVSKRKERRERDPWGVERSAEEHLAPRRDRYLNDRVWGGVHWAWNKAPLLGRLFFREELISSFSRSFSVSISFLSPRLSSRLHPPSPSLSFPSSWHSCDRNPPREVLPKENAPPLTPPSAVLPRSFSRIKCTEDECFPRSPQHVHGANSCVERNSVHSLHCGAILIAKTTVLFENYWAKIMKQLHLSSWFKIITLLIHFSFEFDKIHIFLII